MAFSKIEELNILQAKESIGTSLLIFRNTYPLIDWGNMFLSGGAIGSLLRREPVNDYDFYFKTNESNSGAKELLLNEYRGRIKEFAPEYGGGNGVTDNAITMIDKAQFIMCAFGSPEFIKASFDYEHCCPHYDIGSDQLFISKKQYDAIMNKKLVVHNGSMPPKPWREDKFLGRGWSK